MLNVRIPAILVEKNKEELHELKKSLSKLKEILVVGKAINGNRAMSLIHNFTPQLIIVNVELEDINGLELVRILHNRNVFPEVVFTADNDYYAHESLELEPLDYWIKPFEERLIQQMILRLKSKLKKKELMRKMDIFAHSQAMPAKRVFKQKKGIIMLQPDEIVYCKAELTNTLLILSDGTSTLLKSGIGETLETINNDDFIRISRSYCINRNFLRKIEKRNYKCVLHNEGQTWEVPISKNSIGQLEKLNVYPIY